MLIEWLIQELLSLATSVLVQWAHEQRGREVKAVHGPIPRLPFPKARLLTVVAEYLTFQ